MNLMLEPRKYKSLSICNGKSAEIIFQIDKMMIPSIRDDPENFLGAQITFTRKSIEVKETSWMLSGICPCNTEVTKIRLEYKVSIYNKYLLSAIR